MKRRQFHMIGSNKKSPSKLGKSFSFTENLYRKPILKLRKVFLKNNFQSKLLKIFSFLGETHKAEKAKKWPAIVEIIAE